MSSRREITFFRCSTTLTPSTETVISTFRFLIPRALNSYCKRNERIATWESLRGVQSNKTHANSAHSRDDFDPGPWSRNLHTPHVLKRSSRVRISIHQGKESPASNESVSNVNQSAVCLFEHSLKTINPLNFISVQSNCPAVYESELERGEEWEQREREYSTTIKRKR